VTGAPAEAYVDAAVAALEPLADPGKAAPMRRYLKDVAPFLGVTTPDRRAALKTAWSDLADLDEPELGRACDELWGLPEREYQYAGCDLVDRHRRRLSAAFVADPIERLLTTKPWWDTVDSLESAAICPVTARHPELVDLMWQWLDSGDRWLIRAAIQHQRGRKEATDLAVLFTMCDRYAEDREFFIAKAIGWALRDVTRWDPAAVQSFLDQHPTLSPVARREAIRGLTRPSPP